jgi:hypothetical protein
MGEHEITGLLRELHAKLKTAGAITDADRKLLTQLSADIQSLLAQPDGPAAATRHSVLERLQASIASFEVSHPDLADVMTRASKMLGDMGI